MGVGSAQHAHSARLSWALSLPSDLPERERERNSESERERERGRERDYITPITQVPRTLGARKPEQEGLAVVERASECLLAVS